MCNDIGSRDTYISNKVENNLHKILIIHTWGIGDWLFFTPVIKVLKGTWSDVYIEVILGTPATRSIVELYPEVHIREVVDVRKWPLGMIKAVVKTWPKRYDAVVFTAGVDSHKADKLASLIRADRKIALLTRQHKPRFLSDVAQYNPCIHRVENNLKVLDMLQIKRPNQHSPFLPFRISEKSMPNSILLHPGSGARSAFKRWPIQRFVCLSEKLLRENWSVSVVLGPAEIELAQAFSSLQKNDKFEIYQHMTLQEVLHVVCRHQILLNNDTGLGHLAAALGKRVITIFGPGDPVQVRPYSTNCVVVRTTKDMKCMPCMRSGGQYGCSEAPCVADIEEGSVMEALLEKPISGGNVEIVKYNSQLICDDKF